jgi:hypothetical protein
MKQLMVDNNTAASHSFLLDDDSSIPFSLDDIQQLMDDKARPAPRRAALHIKLLDCMHSHAGEAPLRPISTCRPDCAVLWPSVHAGKTSHGWH